MEALRQCVRHLFSLYLTLAAAISQYIFNRPFLSPFKIQRFQFFVPFVENFLHLYFRYACGLVPCTVDIDDHTTMHFWSPAHRKFNKPNLVMIHGYGGNSKWQFFYQVSSLAESFNLYIPDLIFFGKSNTNCTNRTEIFQAECVRAGLKGLGVERCSIYAISYGGYVGYRMAENYPDMIEKVVIVSSGIGCTEEQRGEQLKKVGCGVVDLLLPDKPDGLRRLIELTVYKPNPFKWAPSFILQEFIEVMCNINRKGKQELVEHLLVKNAACEIKTLTQETLLIWGDKDRVFPLSFAHQLGRNLGSSVKLEVIQNAGHAANIDAPDTLNSLIKGFILPSQKSGNVP